MCARVLPCVCLFCVCVCSIPWDFCALTFMRWLLCADFYALTFMRVHKNHKARGILVIWISRSLKTKHWYRALTLVSFGILYTKEARLLHVQVRMLHLFCSYVAGTLLWRRCRSSPRSELCTSVLFLRIWKFMSISKVGNPCFHIDRYGISTLKNTALYAMLAKVQGREV